MNRYLMGIGLIGALYCSSGSSADDVIFASSEDLMEFDHLISRVPLHESLPSRSPERQKNNRHQMDRKNRERQSKKQIQKPPREKQKRKGRAK